MNETIASTLSPPHDSARVDNGDKARASAIQSWAIRCAHAAMTVPTSPPTTYETIRCLLEIAERARNLAQ